MNKNCIRGRRGGMSWHNTAKSCGLVVEVNAAVVRRRTASLPGEISTARGRASDSAVRSNALGDGREVSRGHSTEIMNRGAERCPFKQRNSQAQLRKDRTGTITRPQYSPRRRLRQDEPDMGGYWGREREVMRGHCSERRGDHRSLFIRG